MIPPPSADSLRHAAELCEFCPKMCRFACPVSEAEPREALTPWGKSSLAALTAAVGRAPDASSGLAFHGCTGCLRCTHYCAHGNDVPTLLFAARAVAVRSGSDPSVLRDLPARLATRGHAEDAELAAVLALLRRGEEEASALGPAEAPPAARTAAASAPLLFAGCETLAQGGQPARDALSAARALGAPLQLAGEGALCCGLPLLEAGHPGQFAAHALKVRAALAGSSPQNTPVNVIFLQPACARAVRDRYPGHGASLPAGSVVEHATTFLARALALRPDLRARPKLEGAVAYHDPCELARGLHETEAPRALLAAAMGGGVREAVRCREDASCCGAGGLLPRTMPAVASAIAAERRAELADTGAPAVTASPACAKALGAGDVIGLLARWLGTR